MTNSGARRPPGAAVSENSLIYGSLSHKKRAWVTGNWLSLAPAFLGLICLNTTAATFLPRTLRIVTYNIAADTGGYTTPRPGLITPATGGTVQEGGVLEGLGEEIIGSDPEQPIDILALQETTSNTVTVLPIVNALNAYYNLPGMYAMSTNQAGSSGGISSGGGPNALVYNTTSLQLLATVKVDPPPGQFFGSSSGEYREVMRYQFAPAGVTPTNTFYAYVSHYKASTGSANETARAGEATIIRNNEATNLPRNARVLYVGDFNLTGGSSEAAYQILLAPSSPNGFPLGQSFDPLNPSGATGIDWSVDSLQYLKTESAASLRYRDDFQLMTSNVFFGDPGGLAYVPGTYHAFGNNGTTPYGSNVNSALNTALTNLAPGAAINAATLLEDLTNASDHLPVVADFTIPVPGSNLRLGAAGFSSSASFGFTVSNADGTAVTANKQSRIRIYFTTNLALPSSDWTLLANGARLTNGFLQVSDTNGPFLQPRLYRAAQTP